MNDLHSLLKRQLRRFTDQRTPLVAEQTDFLRAINDAYWQFDADRRMLEHSLELTSQELLERNAELSGINTELEIRVAERTAELEQSETLFRALFDLSPDAVVVIDPHASWPIIDCNVVACIMNGYQRDELIGQSIDILNLTPGTEDERIAYMKRLRRTGNLKLEVQHRRKDGVVFPVEVSTTLITVGERELVIGIDRNITDRKHAEAALAAERDLLQALMENIPDTIYFKDTASRFTMINRAQAKVLGVAAPEEAIGKTDLDFQDWELAQGFYDEEQRIIDAGEPLINRIEFNPTPDGQPRWFSATKVPIKNPNGSVIGIVGVSRDITLLRQVEEALRQSEERFRLMAWATKDAVWDWNLQTNQIWWGTGLQKIFRYASETAQTDKEWWLGHIHPEDKYKVDRSIDQALEAGMEFWSKEYRFQRVDGTYADVMDRGYIIRDDDGKPYRMIGAMMDITERKQNEETIRHHNEMLSSLHQITLDLLRYREIDQLLGALVKLSAAFLDTSYAEIMLVEGEMLVVKAVTQSQPRSIGERVSRDGALLSWQAFDTHEPAVLSDYANWPNHQAIYDNFPLHAVADFPILNDNQCLGVLSLGRHRPDYEFNSDQIQFGRLFANLTALVLNNAQLREALREQSIRDPLTGLYNRRYMEEALKQQLSRVTRQLHPLGTIMLDIDHFKGINDTYGHAIGDALLREVGQLLKSHVRNEDIACRYGGEEFILIMPDASLEVAQQRAEYLRQAVKGLHVQEAGQSVGITLSMGVAIYPQHGRAKESILHAADTALYRAKQEGRDRVVVAENAT